MNETEVEQCMTDVEVAKIMCVTRERVWRYAADPEMHFPQPRKLGGASRWFRSEINDYLKNLGRVPLKVPTKKPKKELAAK